MHVFLRYISALCLFLTGCSQQDSKKFEDKSARELITMAKNAYNSKSFLDAAKLFDEVERQHPYSDDALIAQLSAAKCYYLCKKYDDAIERFRAFVELHSGHSGVDEAYYMLGLCYYEQIPIVERDQTSCSEAKEAFEEVINRFPSSKYAKDAKMKLNFIQDHLAAKEMNIARYYQKNEHSPQAAINHYLDIATTYQTTSQIEEALFRLVECYITLGVREEAHNITRVFGHNYPKSSWYKKAYRLCLTYPILKSSTK